MTTPRLTFEVTGWESAIATLDALGINWQQIALRAGSAEGQNILTAAARREAPVGLTGNLRDYLYTTVTPAGADALNFRLQSDVPYARYVTEGTRAHDIYPRDAQALMWPGAEHPVRMVHHPGTTANPFLERAITQDQQQVLEAIARAVEVILSAVG